MKSYVAFNQAFLSLKLIGIEHPDGALPIGVSDGRGLTLSRVLYHWITLSACDQRR